MRALRRDEQGARVVEIEPPGLRPGTALVQVALAGVCNTDLELVRGYMDFRGVLGHEFVGVVEDGPSEWIGRRVVGEINFACGRCETCAAGLGRHCPARAVMGIAGADGAFAEIVRVPLANLHAVPDRVPDARAVFTEPLAAAFEILEQVEIAKRTRCAVLGDGKLGLLCAQVLAGAGARVLVVGRHPEKLALLAQRGIETVLAPDWRPEPHDVVVEATGRADGFRAAVAATRPRGMLVLKSTLAEIPRIDLAPIVIHEISVVGSRCGPFEPALRALAEERVEVDSLVSRRVPLARADEALASAAEPGVIKVLIEAS
ncbi:MAG TPA: alcohol dehydrogenase catalytic domain-containing protein [Myxococcota bacterium]|nr:alcohol dehydrogenase catalytic domain-containing protein [Myxococcota bacterium]